MSKPLQGVVNVDIRASEPDWGPFEPPEAPDGAPSVVYIVLDDVGFSALGCYGGPSRRPTSIESPRTACVTRSGTRPRCARRRVPAC
jgi:hypothetical protein